MTDDTVWLPVDSTKPAAVAEACAALERSRLAERASFFNDPRWIVALASEPGRSARIYASRRNAELTGLATFLVHRSAIPIALGELTLFSHPVTRLNALAPPLADAGGDRVGETALVAALLRRIRDDLDPNEVVFVESVAQGTSLFDLIAGRTRVEGFHVLQNGNLYRHRLARIPGSFDGYLQQLGARTRADLRTNRKRFIAHVRQDYHTRCFRSPSEVMQFASDATEVSRKTWQYRLLGSGLREPEALARCYAATASLGWFRSYVLYAGDKPIAFQVGHVYRGCFYAQEIGYDPEWASSHVGIFLHTEVVADLAASNGSITQFDFGTGDNLHKQRLATDSTLEGYFYLIPAHFKGSLVAGSMRAAGKTSAALGSVLGRLGIREQTRDLLRRLGVRK